jgi:glycogen debranching enzyme
MDAVVDGVPVTPRSGYTVELNALWYNAICFSLEMAEASDDLDFISQWQDVPLKLKKCI